ncbi:auxin efflux carrier [Chytridium lagenaria]|nr:auxin efflux carrier [Chytridium lagenaria]
MVAITADIVWASTRPILKLMFVMVIGVIMAKNNTLTPKGSKMIATILIWVLYPCLLFTKVVQGIDNSNLKQFGIMSVASVVMLSVGCLIGYIVLKLTNPPVGFKYATMLAVAMGNAGDLPIAIVLTLGDLPPFNPGDAAKGVAYISGFLCLINLFFFSVGYKLFGQDYKDKALLEPDDTIEDQPDTAPTLPTSHSRTPSVGEGPSDSGLRKRGEVDEKAGETSLTMLSGEGYRVEEVKEVVKTGVWERITNEFLKLRSIKLRKDGKDVFSEEAWFWIKSLTNLANVATVLGLIIATTPPLKSIFRYSSQTTSPPPVGTREPPLLFLFEIFTFLGDAAIPLGLLNLGAALGRLQAKSLLPVRISLAIAASRLVVFPVLGVGLVVGLTMAGVLDKGDKILRFVLIIESCVPTASSTVFLTQMWHPRGEANYIASVVLVQYCFAAFTMILCLTVALTIVS